MHPSWGVTSTSISFLQCNLWDLYLFQCCRCFTVCSYDVFLFGLCEEICVAKRHCAVCICVCVWCVRAAMLKHMLETKINIHSNNCTVQKVHAPYVRYMHLKCYTGAFQAVSWPGAQPFVIIYEIYCIHLHYASLLYDFRLCILLLCNRRTGTRVLCAVAWGIIKSIFVIRNSIPKLVQRQCETDIRYGKWHYLFAAFNINISICWLFHTNSNVKLLSFCANNSLDNLLQFNILEYLLGHFFASAMHGMHMSLELRYNWSFQLISINSQFFHEYIIPFSHSVA